MTNLRFDITPIDALANTARVVVEGAIDATTVITFESQLKQLQEDGYSNFVLDMQGIKYVNSTGLGSLVATADNLEKVGGGLALIKVHPKVKVVFDMLGLNSFFRIFTNEEEAVNFLASRGGGGAVEAAPAAPAAPAPQQRAPAPPPPAPAQRQTSRLNQQPGARPTAAPAPAQGGWGAPAQPAAPQYQPSAQRPPTGQYQQPGARPPAGPPAQRQTQQQPARPGQWIPPSRENPQVVSCPACGASFKISQTGRYKCPSCTTAFVVDPAHGVELAPATSQLTLSFTPECKDGLGAYLGAMMRRAGYADGEYGQVRQALEQLVDVVLRNAYQNRIYESYAIAFLPARHNLQIKFIVSGPTMNGDPRQFFPMAAQIMPDLAVRPHPKGGSVIVMSYRR
ncbi:MAG: anti-sigma factor antagonist [Planctomycetes bacterium]|nr:anti-sigma factor antagonist [Planctomycetota bacterium]